MRDVEQMVGKRIAVSWLLSDGEYESFHGWVVFFDTRRQKHIVVYDCRDSTSKRRAYAHNLSKTCYVPLDGQSNHRHGMRWSDEDTHLLLAFEKRIACAGRHLHGRGRLEDEGFLWAAAACELGRFIHFSERQSFKHCFDSLTRQLAILNGKYSAKVGRAQAQIATGVTRAIVRGALRSLPGCKGTLQEVRTAVEERHPEGLDQTVAAGYKTLRRWEKDVQNQLVHHRQLFEPIKEAGKRIVYKLCTDAAEPKASRARKPRKKQAKSMDYIKAFRK